MSHLDSRMEDTGPAFVEASARIEQMLLEPGRANLDWLVSHLFDRSPEFLFLIVTPVAIVPATSTFAGALLLATAIPMIFHRQSHFLPRGLAFSAAASARVERAFQRLVAMLKRYEAYARRHPHPPAPRHTRLVGFLVVTLALALLVPLPLSNVLPGFAVGTVALASLEQDGKLMLVAALLTGISILAVIMEAASAFHLAARFL